MPTIDLAIAWTWEHDADFVRLLECAAEEAGLRTLSIRRENIAPVTEAVRGSRLHVRAFLDRASDEDEAFLPLALHLNSIAAPDGAALPIVINRFDRIRSAADKATMHLEFLSAGIRVPYTIIISPFSQTNEVDLTLTELEKLGRPFIIKPANTTGGGVGVVVGAESLRHVLEARQSHKNDKYLLQETIRPVEWSGRRAWFRSFFVCGEILLCWWDDQTHRYREVTDDERRRYGLHMLEEMTGAIRRVCRLDFFSTEVAFTADADAVSVDYVNELCDMRLQSAADDGVPDNVVRRVCRAIVGSIVREGTGRAGETGAPHRSRT